MAERYTWTPNDIAEMTPAQFLMYLPKGKDARVDTVRMSFAEARQLTVSKSKGKSE